MDSGRTDGPLRRPIVVTFLGPDGSGKSTVIAEAVAALEANGVQAVTYHFRPHFGRPYNGKPVSKPHAVAPWGFILSQFKLALVLVDFTIGMRIVKRLAVRTGASLVIFDRYYYDLIVDPRRNRYRGPRWLTVAGGRLAAAPDISFVLTAPPEVLHSRKPELPLAEVARQLDEYREVTRGLRGTVILDVSASPEAVVAEVSRCIQTALDLTNPA
jgi:thymidylate kinase